MIYFIRQLFDPRYLAPDFSRQPARYSLTGHFFKKRMGVKQQQRQANGIKTSHMKIIFFLIATSLLLALGFLAAFLWAVRSGQYEDEYTPSIRILLDDPAAPNADNQPIINDNQPLTTTNQL